MSSKIEVSREQLEEWQKTALQWGIDSIGVGIMHALASPVVERQPLIHITPQVLGMLKGELRMQSGGITFSESAPIGNWTVPLYEAPPELAELQATIDRLTEENERLTIAAKYCEEIDATPENQLETICYDLAVERDKLKSEIERLKGGQGEAVAEVVNHQSRDMCKVTVQNVKLLRSVPDGTKLYSSQPATVSAVDERAEFDAWYERNGFTASHVAVEKDFVVWMARAQLGKVKELNQ